MMTGFFMKDRKHIVQVFCQLCSDLMHVYAFPLWSRIWLIFTRSTNQCLNNNIAFCSFSFQALGTEAGFEPVTLIAFLAQVLLVGG